MLQNVELGDQTKRGNEQFPRQLTRQGGAVTQYQAALVRGGIAGRIYSEDCLISNNYNSLIPILSLQTQFEFFFEQTC